MKKRLLQLGAVILCIMMCLCGTVSVFAADATMIPLAKGDTKAASIVVNVAQDEATIPAGMRATAFRIITVNVIDGLTGTPDGSTGEGSTNEWQPAEPVYSWAPGVSAWVQANYPQYIDEKNDNAVKEAYRNATETEMAAFIDALAAAIKHGDTGFGVPTDGVFANSDAPLVKSATFDGRSSTTISALSKGSYIVLIENGNKVYKPSVANFTPEWATVDGKTGWYIQNPVTVGIKVSGVTLDKKVSNSENGTYGSAVNAAIGDTVWFDITAAVPEYPAKALDKTFIIKDTLPKGLTLQAIPKVYDKDGTEIPASAYTYTAEGKSFTFNFKYDSISDKKSVTVKYSATLNKDAVLGSAGNVNKAELTYTNNPYIENGFTTIKKETPVYTYGLALTKTNNVDVNPEYLAGAVFVVERQDDNDEKVWHKLTFVEESGNVYRYTRSTGDSETATDQVKTGSDGKLNLNGLDDGTYRLREIEAPAGGYVLPKDYIYFTITDVVDAKNDPGMDGIPDKDGKNVTNEGAENGYLALTVKNSKGFDLPLTGGMGTILFTAGGIVLVAGAVVLLLVANKKKSRRS